MSNYTRTLPRDLFNESALLRDIGKLWLALEGMNDSKACIVQENVEFFDIIQDPSSGNISVRNIDLMIGGEKYLLERPLNSRDNYPLMTMRQGDPDYDYTEVFDEEGEISEEMKSLLSV